MARLPFMAGKLDVLLREVRACRICAGSLSLGPRPVVRAEASARLLIIGQAPGSRVHASGIPWDDASGDRLRTWMALDRPAFYDTRRVAIVPMGFCYPGRDANGGDRPPRPECAPQWHERILGELPSIQLTLLVGRYAQARYLPQAGRASMTETVAAWRDHLPAFIALPHPSWRNTAWLRRNSWFEREVVPELRRRIADLVDGQGHHSTRSPMA